MATAEAFYKGIKTLIDFLALLEHYKMKAIERRSFFDKRKTVTAVENMFHALLSE